MSELRFSSTQEAIQHLSDVSGSRIIVADNFSELQKNYDNMTPEDDDLDPEDIFFSEIEELENDFESAANGLDVEISDLSFENLKIVPKDKSTVNATVKISVMEDSEAFDDFIERVESKSNGLSSTTKDGKDIYEVSFELMKEYDY